MVRVEKEVLYSCVILCDAEQPESQFYDIIVHTDVSFHHCNFVYSSYIHSSLFSHTFKAYTHTVEMVKLAHRSYIAECYLIVCSSWLIR